MELSARNELGPIAVRASVPFNAERWWPLNKALTDLFYATSKVVHLEAWLWRRGEKIKRDPT